jgi:hypothetical protein
MQLDSIAYANYYYDNSVPLSAANSTSYNPAIISSKIKTVFDANPSFLINPHYIRREGHDDEYIGIKTALFRKEDEDSDDLSYFDDVVKSHHGLEQPLNLPLTISPSGSARGVATLSVDVNSYMTSVREKLGVDVCFRSGEAEDVKFVYDGDIHNGKLRLLTK